MLFINPIKPFQYDMHALKLSEYIEKYDEFEGENFKTKSLKKWNLISRNFIKINLMKLSKKEEKE